MNLLLFNHIWMAEELRNLGARVTTVGADSRFDIKIPRQVLDIRSVLALLPKGYEPDAIVIYDESMALPFSGIPECGIPWLYYAIDVHHHHRFQRYLGREAAWFLVAQKDFIPFMQHATGAKGIWMPLWASKIPKLDLPRENKAIFIGNMDPNLNRDRVEFFGQIQERVFGFEARRGEWPEAFATNQVVLNQTVRGDVNFRIFETMISGAVCLTEYSGNGLEDLFTNHRNIELYKKGDVGDAIDKISYLLSNPKISREIAQAGYEEVAAKHLPIHRAEFLLETLSRPAAKPVTPNLAMLINFNHLASVAQKNERPDVRKDAIETGFRYLKAGMEANEEFDGALGTHAVMVCTAYDAILSSNAGAETIMQIVQTDPNIKEKSEKFLEEEARSI